MGLIPDTKVGKIQFFQSKVTPWTTNALAIGTTAGEVTAMNTKLTTAQAALASQVAAYAAAKTSTETLDNAIAALVGAGSDIIKQIKTKAAISGPSVYELAQIPAPATPTPVGPPGTPTDFKVTLQPTGALELKWKCPNPASSAGTIYNVYRAPAGSDEFQYLGGSGRRQFVDFSLPSGLASVTYQIQAIRSTAVGVANEFLVKFGVSSGGAMTATVVQSGPKPAKIAA